MSKISIRNLDLNGKRVFIRADFNVPLTPGGQEISSDKRIRASLPTIRYALDRGAALVLASHLGRPKGKPNAEMSLRPVGKRLEELLGRAVAMAPDCVGPQVQAMLPVPGGVLRRLCERRVRLGASRARVNRRNGRVRAPSRRGSAHGAGIEVPDHGDP